MVDEPASNARTISGQVNAVPLPKIYQEIGRRVAKLSTVPASLKHHFDAIATLKPAVEAKDPAAISRLREVYQSLGREAHQTYGEKAVPKDIAPYLAEALATQESLPVVPAQVAVEAPAKIEIPRRLRDTLTQSWRKLQPKLSDGYARLLRIVANLRGLAAAGAPPQTVSVQQAFLTMSEGIFKRFWPVRPVAGIAIAALLIAGIILAFTSRGLGRATRPVAKWSATPHGSAAGVDQDFVDPAVLIVLRNTSEKHTTHGWRDVELGQTFDQVARKYKLRPDIYAPWIFQNTQGEDSFVFDSDGVLRVYAKEVTGGPSANAEELLQQLGKTPNEEITRAWGNSVSWIDSTTLYWVFPAASVIVLLEFQEIRIASMGRVEASEKTLLRVIDLQWALPILCRSAALKRPLLDWMQIAKDRVAAFSFDTQSVPDVLGTEKDVIGSQAGGQMWLRLIEKPTTKSDHRRESERLVGSVAYLSKERFQAMPRGGAGVTLLFYKYNTLAGDVLLKRDNNMPFYPGMRDEALWGTPGLVTLDGEITRVLMQEYYPPQGGEYKFVKPAINSGHGFYTWQTRDARGDRLWVTCNTTGEVSVTVLPNNSL